jgi:hypothetical protein
MAVDILVSINILFNEAVLIHFSGPQFILCSYIIYHGNLNGHGETGLEAITPAEIVSLAGAVFVLRPPEAVE